MNIHEAVKEYQCPGCVDGPGPEGSCFQSNGAGCERHIPGTLVFPSDYVCCLGLPKGFNRVSRSKEKRTKIFIYDTFEAANKVWSYDLFNIPTWATKDEHGNTLVRVYQPRIDESSIHIILEDCLEKVKPVYLIGTKEKDLMD